MRARIHAAKLVHVVLHFEEYSCGIFSLYIVFLEIFCSYYCYQIRLLSQFTIHWLSSIFARYFFHASILLDECCFIYLYVMVGCQSICIKLNISHLANLLKYWQMIHAINFAALCGKTVIAI
jgi:hypothetical protein